MGESHSPGVQRAQGVPLPRCSEGWGIPPPRRSEGSGGLTPQVFRGVGGSHSPSVQRAQGSHSTGAQRVRGSHSPGVCSTVSILRSVSGLLRSSLRGPWTEERPQGRRACHGVRSPGEAGGRGGLLLRVSARAMLPPSGAASGQAPKQALSCTPPPQRGGPVLQEGPGGRRQDQLPCPAPSKSRVTIQPVKGAPLNRVT